MPKKNISISMPSFVRCVILSSISMLLFCLGVLIPSPGIVALIFSPAPLALLGVRENKALMAVGLFCVTSSLWLVFGSGVAVAFLLGYGLLCFGLTLPLGKLEKGTESLLFCVIISIISKVLFVSVSVALGGSNPFAMDQSSISAMLDNMYSGMLGQGGQDAARLKEALAHALEFLPHMLPFFLIAYSVFDSFVNYKLCELLQRKREGEKKFPPLPPFGDWRFPSSLLYVFAFAFFLPLLSQEGGSRLWVTLEYNLKFLLNLFFFLQGMALVWWWLSKYAARRSFPLPLRVLLVGLLALPVLNAWIAALGVGDICVDFRTKKIRRA